MLEGEKSDTSYEHMTISQVSCPRKRVEGTRETRCRRRLQCAAITTRQRGGEEAERQAGGCGGRGQQNEREIKEHAREGRMRRRCSDRQV